MTDQLRGDDFSIDRWLERDRAAAEEGRRRAKADGREYAVLAANWDGTTVTIVDPDDPTPRRLGWVVCEAVRSVSFGPPDDETLSSHPLYAAGLRHYQAHDVYDPHLAPGERRLVMTFHDETLDCTCRDWTSGELVADFRTALALAARAVRDGAQVLGGRRGRSAGVELDPTRLPQVQLFRSRAVLDRAVEARESGWSIIRFDARRCATAAAMRTDLADALSFPDYCGRNLDALNDCMRDVVAGDYGSAKHSVGGLIVIDAFDRFHRREPQVAQVLMDVLGGAAVDALAHRWQLATFLRVDDPDFAPPPFAAQAAIWNPQEWLRANQVDS